MPPSRGSRGLALEDGKPAEREGIDTIVMGSRGLDEIDAMTFVSVSHQICRDSSCTCISIK